eukprot:Pgem_evm1s5926
MIFQNTHYIIYNRSAMASTCCGIIFPIHLHPEKLKALCPLEKVSVDCKIVDMVAEVKVRQQFYNPSDAPIEGQYVFPLDEKAAVCEFEAEVDGKVVVGVVKEKEQARKEFQEAKELGQTAYLLEEHKADVFELSMGNLPARSTINVSLTYLTELKLSNGEISFVLPTKVAPRYNKYDADYVPATNTTCKNGLDLNIEVNSQSAIKKISSETHGIQTALSSNNNKKEALVSLRDQQSSLDKDVVININTEQYSKPRICVETNEDGSRAMMLTLVPQIELDDAKCELIFVVDRSGSMRGNQMERAKEALQLFMRSLPEDCYFNIVGFGSRYVSLFEKSEQLNRDSLQKASSHIEQISADLGGTELGRPLEHVFSKKDIPYYTRQVFVLTDGQINDTDQVCSLVKKAAYKSNTRTFALGLGNCVSRNLVEGIARAGNGTAEFVSGDQRLQKTVIQQLQQALQPAMTDITIDWGVISTPNINLSPAPSSDEENVNNTNSNPINQVKTLLGFRKPDAKRTMQIDSNANANTNKAPLMQTPYKARPIFTDTRFIAYLFLKPDDQIPSKVLIKAITPEGPLSVELDIEEENKFQGDLIHKMAARSMIRDLEEKSSYMHLNRAYFTLTNEDVKKEIERLGCLFSLVSKHTSFIAVDKSEKKETVIYAQEEEEIVETEQSETQRVKCMSIGNGRKSLKSACPVPAPSQLPMNICLKSAFSVPAPRGGGGCPPPPAPLIHASLIEMNEKQESLNDQVNFFSIFSCDDEKEKNKPRSQCSNRVKKKQLGPSSDKVKKIRSSNSCSKPVYSLSKDDISKKIVLLQEFDGSFKNYDDLSKLVGAESTLMQSTMPGICKNSNIWLSFIALAYFKVYLVQYQDELVLVLNKLEKFLKKNCQENLATLKNKSEEFVRNSCH